MKIIKRTLLASIACLIGLGGSMALTTQAIAQDKPTLRLGYVQTWPSSVVTTQLAATVIENEFGYPVEMVAADPGLLYQGVATGDLDAHVSAWLPVTHESYYAKVFSDVLNVGPNVIGTKNGLVVPKYVTIDTIAELKEHADQFDHKIVGIDAGAGVMESARNVIKQYNLDYQLLSSSTAGMVAALDRAVRKEEWVVITGWSPLWIWSKYNLKYLKDTKGLYEKSGYVETLTSQRLPKKAPEIFAFLRRFRISIDSLNSMTLALEEGKSDQQAVDDWLAANPDILSTWVAGIGTKDSAG